MNKTETVKARIEPELKEHVHTVFYGIGETPTKAIRMFYRYFERKNSFPFHLSIPNKETAKTIREAKAGRGLVESKSLENLFTDLDI